MLKVAVVVPVYNGAKTISKCLEALTNQDYARELFEVIVVDDGSIDSTPDIIKGFSGVRYERQANSGPATARNRGARLASKDCELILFTDSDCVPRRDWIKEMARPFADASVIAVKGAYESRQPELMARFCQIEFEERFELLKKSDSIDMIDTYSAGFRRDVFLKLGGFDTSFPEANNEDTELSYRLAKLGHKMVFNPNAVVAHLNHPASVKRYARLKFWRGYWRMVVYKRYPDKMLKDTYTPISLKAQTALALLMLLDLPVIAAYPLLGLLVMLLLAVLFMVISLSFLSASFKKDLSVFMLTPFFLMLRAHSLALGSVWGYMNRNKHG